MSSCQKVLGSELKKVHEKSVFTQVEKSELHDKENLNDIPSEDDENHLSKGKVVQEKGPLHGSKSQPRAGGLFSTDRSKTSEETGFNRGDREDFPSP